MQPEDGNYSDVFYLSCGLMRVLRSGSMPTLGEVEPMATPVNCTICRLVLVAHCDSRTCRWQTCPRKSCAAQHYDLDHGRLLLESGRVEHIA